MLKIGSHNDSWKNASIPRICKNLEIANAIACVKELYKLGRVTDEHYESILCKLLYESGYDYDEIKVEKS